MKKYIFLFLIGAFLGFWEDQINGNLDIQKNEGQYQGKENMEDTLLKHPCKELPKYKYGTNKELLKIVMTKLVYSKEGCFNSSTVVIAFTVNKKGLVENPRIKRSICAQVDTQLLKIIKEFEFIPGKIDDEITSMELNFPLRICLK